MTTPNHYAAHKLLKDIISEADACTQWGEEYVTTPETIETVIVPAATALAEQVNTMPIEDRNQGEANYTWVAGKLHILDFNNQEKMYAGHAQIVEAAQAGALLEFIAGIVDTAA